MIGYYSIRDGCFRREATAQFRGQCPGEEETNSHIERIGTHLERSERVLSVAKQSGVFPEEFRAVLDSDHRGVSGLETGFERLNGGCLVLRHLTRVYQAVDEHERIGSIDRLFSSLPVLQLARQAPREST